MAERIYIFIYSVFLTFICLSTAENDVQHVCPSQSTCKCDILKDVTTFSCRSHDEKELLQYTITYNRSISQVYMECPCVFCSVPYKKEMFAEFDFPVIESLHLMNCQLPNISFIDLIGNFTPSQISISVFQKVDVLNATVFRNLSYVTRLTMRSGELNSIQSNAFDDLVDLEEVDLNMNGLRSLPDGIFDKNIKLKSVILNGNSLSKIPKIKPILRNLENFSFNNNRLSRLPDDVFSFAPNLKSLSLSHNRLRVLSANVLRNLSDLRVLELSFNELNELPEELLQTCENLTEFRMRLNENLTSLPEKFFIKSTNLEIIDLGRNNLSSIPATLLSNLTQLKSLDLSQNRLSDIPPDLFTPAYRLRYIDLSINQLFLLPLKLFDPLVHLRTVKLYNNKLSSIPKDLFSGLPALNELDLSNNDIEIIDEKAFEGSDNITFIDLSFNDIRIEREPFDLPISIMHLNMSYNQLNYLPESWSQNEYFLGLNLTHNLIRSVNAMELLFKSKQVVIDLTNNVIETVNLQGIDSIAIDQPPVIETDIESVPKILIEDNPFNCDCNLLEFVKYLKTRNLNSNAPIFFEATNLKCSLPINSITKGQNLEAVTEDNLYCSITDKCFPRCQCRKTPISQVTEVHCQGKEITDIVTEVPFNSSKLYFENNHITSLKPLGLSLWSTVTEIHLSNNDIVDIEEVIVIPTQLKLLTLDGNKLTHMPMWLMEEISVNKFLTVTLGNNSWNCDCDAVPFQIWLTNVESGKVSDISGIKCIDERFYQRKITSLTKFEMCPHQNSSAGSAILVSVLTTLILLVILGITVVCVYRNRFHVRMWLFRHRLCLWMRTEDDVEAGHPL